MWRDKGFMRTNTTRSYSSETGLDRSSRTLFWQRGRVSRANQANIYYDQHNCHMYLHLLDYTYIHRILTERRRPGSHEVA